MSRLIETYRKEIVPILMEDFGYRNLLEAPRLVKIVVNIGLGEALEDAKALDGATRDLSTITGQVPIITRARKCFLMMIWTQSLLDSFGP